ncbi:hypothetical protein OF83DRAFT_1273034, partial [Amylostereum chailletii]
MVLNTSPRKIQVPLASGDWESASTSKAGSVTKRVFFCGVVVESENGRELSEDVRELVSSLGEPLGSYTEEDLISHNQLPVENDTDNKTRRRAMTDSSAIQDIINELVTTEQYYVKKLHILKHDYADPLRMYARSKETAIISAYDANTLFGNIDNLIPVNEAFLQDLEKMVLEDGPQTVGHIGDVVLRHFKELRGFEQYKQYYTKREEAQAILERENGKRSRFATFIDRIKYSSGDASNRIGLSQLIMDPVQRIPRYTLMFRTMMKRMSPGDPQRAKLAEADEIASKIALAETDEDTRRASIMHCIAATVEGFPPGLYSSSRRLIDCIDVEDGSSDAPSAVSSASSLEPLHCTLFLFDDKLMIVKRPGNGEKSGRTLSGLDQVEKVMKSGGLPLGLKKSGMSCKGVVDITDVAATDVGGADIHVFFENPPQDQTDRWAGRPFRALSLVFPPSPPNFNPQRTEADKKRFLENLWHAQAILRTKSGNSILLRAEEREVESRGGRTTLARTYFNVYQRTAFLKEPRKTKVVVQIDSLGAADPIPFGIQAPPLVCIRVQPIAGELSRYKVTSNDPNDINDEDIVQTSRVPDRIVQTSKPLFGTAFSLPKVVQFTVHQYGLFKFNTGKNSIPSTPTATTRSRAAIFSLDALSRNLFNALPGSSKGDVFGGTFTGSRRSKSSTTRSSVYTQSSEGSLMRFSQRSNSTLTGATSMSSMEDESFTTNKSSRSRKLLKKRSKSPNVSGNESEAAPQRRSHSRTRSMSRGASPAPSEPEDDTDTLQPHKGIMDESEWNLAQRLELARRNSQNHAQPPTLQSWEAPVEKPYTRVPPQPIRPTSRASRIPTKETSSQRSTTPQPRPTTPASDLGSPTRMGRSSSRTSTSRPRGPRSPSPLPSPQIGPAHDSSLDIDFELQATLNNLNHPPTTPPSGPSALPRSQRQPFEPTRNSGPASKSVPNGVQKTPSIIEPLSIKKRTTGGLSAEALSHRKTYPKTSPLMKGRVVSPRASSLTYRHGRASATPPKHAPVDINKLFSAVESTKEDIETGRRALKRIKLDAEQLRGTLARNGDDEDLLPRTPRGLPRTPQRSNPPISKAAQERLDEMRQLIGKRMNGDVGGTPRSRPRSVLGGDVPQTPTHERTGSQSQAAARGEELVQLIDDAACEADKTLLRASSHQEALGLDIALLANDLKEKASLLEKARHDLQNSKRQCELVKELLRDASTETDIVFDTFNEELDKMFQAVNLPEDEAWTAMTADLRQTKLDRSAFQRENSCVSPPSFARLRP